MRKSQQKPASSNLVAHKLLKLENLLHKRNEPAISTLTWFRGDYTKASVILKRRVQLIMEKNPWLAGRVVKRNGELVLEYNSLTCSSSSLDEYFVVVDPAASPFARSTPIETLGKLSEKLLLKNGPNEPVFRVSIVPSQSNPQTHFALVVSLSHIVGDGATFYKIHEMICSKDNDSIVNLIVERIPTSEQQQAATMGQQEFEYGTRLSLLINALIGLLRVKTIGPPVECRIVLLDDLQIQQIKLKATMENTDVSFVSTNDVLTNWFLQASGCNAGLMYVNFRNRLDGHTDYHAGNYDAALFYNQEDSKMPALIRKSLDKLKRAVTTNMPSFFETLTSSHAIATNWTSFAKLNIVEECTEELHVPLYNVEGTVPYSFCVMLIFRAGPNRRGLYLIGQPNVLDRLQSAPFFSSDQL